MMDRSNQQSSPGRLRLAQQVDLTKANPACKRCHGTGRLGFRLVDLPAGPASLPLVCRCVVRRGGVQPDALDRVATTQPPRNTPATVAAGIQQLPWADQAATIARLQRAAQDNSRPAEQRAQIAAVLRLVNEGVHA